MKTYDEKSEAILISRAMRIEGGKTDGNLSESKMIVDVVEMFIPVYLKGQVTGYNKVSLTKHQIVSIYEKIKEIEINTVMVEFDELPF